MTMESDPCLVSLRHELKAWEKFFSAANDGRKAGREDIKSNPAIAAKYREYDRVRRRGHGEQQQRTPRKSSTSCTGPAQTSQQTIALPIPIVETPSRRRVLPAGNLQAPSPFREPSPTPQAVRQRLGPTPQKDGQILSLFDGLYSGTPSKPQDRDPLACLNANVLGTPSRRAHGDLDVGDNVRQSRTPQSTGKRYMLDTFATPQKRKLDDVACTPSSGRGSLGTPAFLRRSNTDFMAGLDTLGEDEEMDALAKGAPPLKKRGLVRSLSTIIRNLRKQEEDRQDEELEMLREMEMEAEAEAMGQSLPLEPQPQAALEEPKVMIEDSQIEMPLGPDQGSDSEEDEGPAGDGLDQHGNPRKVWKKKGLKRQTKRVIMRPVRHKAKEAESDPKDDSEDEAVVEETQLPNAQSAVPDEDASDAEFSGDEDADFSDSGIKRRKNATRALSPKRPVAAAQSEAAKTGDQANPVKKAARKISATAHANFRKLKIKNKNSKANGRGGRFGRR